MPHRIMLPCDELRAGYIAGQSTAALAHRFGCSPTTIAKYLRSCGVPLRNARFASIAIDAATLRRVYLDERRPIAAIASHFGVCASTIGNKRRRYGIPTRPRRAAVVQLQIADCRL
jgi:transposase-like protein